MILSLSPQIPFFSLKYGDEAMVLSLCSWIHRFPRASADSFWYVCVYSHFFINPLTSKERKKCMFVGCLILKQQKSAMFYMFSIMIADDLVTGAPWASTDIMFCEKLV